MTPSARITIAAALLAGGIAWHASLPAPVGPAAGAALEGEVVGQSGNLAECAEFKDTFRIGTFNIHGCKGLDGRRDVGRVAECLRDLDFVALNEVHGPWAWQDMDQAGQLGQRVGLAWLFAPNSQTWRYRQTGNGLLSALPVSFWQRIPLERRSSRGYRNAVLVGLRHRGRTIHVLLTHIARSDQQEREQQLRTVLALFQTLAEPAILLGDLNTEADAPLLRDLLAMPGVHDPVDEVLGEKAPRRIDWIITRGLRCHDAGVRENDASDHPLVWAELE